MKRLAPLLFLALALGMQSALGAIWPEAPRYVDIMLVPVVWCALASQRTGLWIGCGAGLLQDAWFQTDVFGINGFKKTALGWLLGWLGARFDVRHQPARFASGLLAGAGDVLMDVALRRLLDQHVPAPQPLPIVSKTVLTGILVVATFGVTRRFEERPGRRRGM